MRERLNAKNLRKMWIENVAACTYNLRIPEDSDFFQGASSGSYGIGPWTINNELMYKIILLISFRKEINGPTEEEKLSLQFAQ